GSPVGARRVPGQHETAQHEAATAAGDPAAGHPDRPDQPNRPDQPGESDPEHLPDGPEPAPLPEQPPTRSPARTGQNPRGREPTPSDQELTRRLQEAYRLGTASPTAGEILYRRHRDAALAYARTCCRALHDAEDLVSEAFIRTFQAVRSGGGPRGPWRPYLLTVIRHTAIEWSAGARQVVLTADFESWQQRSTEADPQQRLLADEDRTLLIRSFQALPARWRTVLWHTLVEDASPQRVAALMGLSPSGLTSLAFRAREGLREAYLRAHMRSTAADDDRCRHFGSMIGASVRRGAVRGRALARHLAECRFCAHAYTELLALNAAMPDATRATGSTPPTESAEATEAAETSGASGASGCRG
ncbi:sigma-70 family RNA polymerase sigma factor, partial [Streptomyces sp. NPDC059679]|uniref:sigma-70 family RNA polymerase sigma factor n=1 Tax=Streptomyces sp. NPDC059679 TaxID=3346903 RepID=UPI00369CCA4C